MSRTEWAHIGLYALINLLILVIWWIVQQFTEFSSPRAFWLLLFIPVLSTIILLRRFSNVAEVKLPTLSFFPKQTIFSQLSLEIPNIFRLLGLTFLIITLARPQSSSSYENLTREGIDIVLALDVSASMLSRDFDPSRLESAKSVAIKFVDERPDDRIAVVVYEGEGFTQVPLTTDHRVVKNGIKELETGWIEGGTAIGLGLATAVNRLKESEAKGKVIILLTDGINNAGQIDPIDAAQLAKMFGIRVYTIGVGSIGKARSPIGKRGNQWVFDWVDVEIDEAILKNIAETTGGRYFRATSEAKLKEIYGEIDSLEKTRFNVLQVNKKTEEFIPFILISLAFFLLEFVFKSAILRTSP
jgi:Ca-activated chloride channel homolog